jgi:hypothetical protein
MSSAAQATDRLATHLAAIRREHAVVAADPGLAAALAALRGFQSARLTATYADLARDARYADAIAFFRSDLYGPGDFSRRDADLARIVPLMTRVLPARLIEAAADAVELNALSQRLDLALIGELDPRSTLGVATYSAAYRAAGRFAVREQQIALIGVVGRAIDRYARKAALRQALRLMRAPARASGVGALQDFLERGLAAFAKMRGAGEFLAIVDARERAIHAALVAGEHAPFAPPQGA